MKNRLIVLSLLLLSPFIYGKGSSYHNSNDSISKHGFYIPKNIEECNIQFDQMFDNDAKELIKSSEDPSLKQIWGVMVINEWIEDETTRLYSYFARRGVTDYEDRNYLMLLSYKKHMRGEALNFEEECKHIVAYNDSVVRERKLNYEKSIMEDSINHVYIPKDLEDCLVQLDKVLKDEDKKEIREADDALTFHFGLGMWIRNNWGLGRGSRLQQWLIKEGFSEPDGMSTFILYTYQEYLKNSKTIDIKKKMSDRKLQQEEFMEIALKIKTGAITPANFDDEDYYRDEYKEFLKTKKMTDVYIYI